MRTNVLCALVGAFLLSGCGSDDDGGSHPGEGTGTLFVDAKAKHEGGNAALRAVVLHAGQPVNDAQVTFESDLGEATLTFTGGGVYLGGQPGWASYYRVRVNAPSGSLHGSVEAAAPAHITEPNPAAAFDARASQTIDVRWDGPPAHHVRVKSQDFEWSGSPDPKMLTVSTSIFVESNQDVEIERKNEQFLAGGITGSTIKAEADAKTTLLVANPFPN